MPKTKSVVTEHEPKRIGLLGATFDTGCMGVAALAEASIKCILNRWPNVRVILLGSSREPGEHRLRINGSELRIKTMPIRFCRNLCISDHFCVLVAYALMFKIFRWRWFKQVCSRYNRCLKEIIEIDIVADITGGDSFSDIYGMRRFVLGFLRKWLVLLYGKKLIMLPQTYGPFKGTLTKTMAKYIMRRASVIYSRDRSGVSYVRELLNNRNFENKVRFVPDVAFVLDSHKPENIDIGLLETVRAKDSVVIGLNVSGLLYNRGHIMNEMFGLKTDYRQLVYQLARLLLKNDKVKLLLVPHVLPPAPAVINDAVACLELYKQLGREHPGRKFLVKGKYDQGEIKYIIGLCDFFIGSRMHACIAALSQCIPTVGIAYSDKFRGVFESVGVGYCVADARNMDIKGVFEIIESAYNKRVEIQKYLHKRAPSNIKAVLSIFNELK